MRRELMLFGVKVIMIEPRGVGTPIWNNAEVAVVQQFPNTPYDSPLGVFAGQAMREAKTGFPSQKVGELIWRVFTTARPRARYPFLRHRLLQCSIPRRLPTQCLDSLVSHFSPLRSSSA